MDTAEAYRALGLSHSASDAELKACWRKLVATWHPDRNPAAEAVQRMQAINKAYQHIRLVREGKLTDDAPAEETDAPATDSPR
jgi:molecular chaperone DnaJ